MKLTGKKDIVAERLRGRAEVDRVWLERIRSTMGDKFELYRLKAENPEAFPDPEIVTRFNETLALIAGLEEQRQDWQKRCDDAKTALEIDTIIEGLKSV